jgi:hypothetical protein
MEIKRASELQQIIADRLDTEPVSKVAGDLEIAEVYVLQIVSGHRPVSKKVAQRMGYEIYAPEKLFVPIVENLAKNA